MRHNILQTSFLFAFILILISSCNASNQTSVTSTALPPGTLFSTIEPTAAPATAIPPATVKMALIAVNDQGVSGPRIGCGDSVVMVDVPFDSTVDPLASALNSLLAVKTQYYGQPGLYDSLYQNDLIINSISYDAAGVPTVHLTGSLTLGGECDNPRVQAQLDYTARQFPEISGVAFFINDQPLSDFLSLK